MAQTVFRALQPVFRATRPKLVRFCNVNSSMTNPPKATSDFNRYCVVDPLAMATDLEAQGLSSEQSKAIAKSISGAFNNSLEVVHKTFLKNSDFEKFEIRHKSEMSCLKAEVTKDLDKVSSNVTQVSTEMSAKAKIVELEGKEKLVSAKYNMVKYFFTTIFSTIGVGFGLLRIMKEMEKEKEKEVGVGFDLLRIMREVEKEKEKK